VTRILLTSRRGRRGLPGVNGSSRPREELRDEELLPAALLAGSHLLPGRQVRERTPGRHRRGLPLRREGVPGRRVLHRHRRLQQLHLRSAAAPSPARRRGCSDGGAATCAYGGKRYEAGASFPSADGLQHLFVRPRRQRGLHRARVRADGGAGGCAYYSTRYEPGASFPPRRLQHLRLRQGRQRRLHQEGLPARARRRRRLLLQRQAVAGGPGFPSSDGCNSCSCTASGDVALHPARLTRPARWWHRRVCRTVADCRLFDDYCHAAATAAPSRERSRSKCARPGVRCLRAPCADKAVACEAGRCVVKTWRPALVPHLRRAPVPRMGQQAGRSLCSTQQAGGACSTPGRALRSQGQCATGSRVRGDRLPPSGQAAARSPAATPEGIHYLTPRELRAIHDDLPRPQAGHLRYKEDPARAALGFIIDDLDARAPGGGLGFLARLWSLSLRLPSLAVATLQLQARRCGPAGDEVEELGAPSSVGPLARRSDGSSRHARPRVSGPSQPGPGQARRPRVTVAPARA
jgi:hypothetical protein